MKKNLLVLCLLPMALVLSGQHLVTGSTDVVGLTGYPAEPQLVEADRESFYWISGSNYSSVNHPLLTEVYNDYSNLFFIKYDAEGNPKNSNYIRGTYYARNAFSFEGGLTLMAKSDQDVDASGQVLPIGNSYEQEFLASYDPDCKLMKAVSIWNLGFSDFIYSDAKMDPADGSIYVYGITSDPKELVGFGTLGQDVSESYFYVIKYKRDLELQWAYTAGFDMDASGISASFPRIDVHPGKDGMVLVTGSYNNDSSPLIHGRSLPSYADSYGMFAVLLDDAGNSQWVQDGHQNGYAHATRIFEAYPMPDGDFVLAGVSNTGYFKLGPAEIDFPGGENYENLFVYRMAMNGEFRWARPIQNMRPNQDKKKKSAQSDVFQSYVNYDAINWRNKVLYLSGFFNTATGFSVAGRALDVSHLEGIFTAAIDMGTGTEIWGYGLTSDYLNLHGFDVDRSGNVSLMGSLYNTLDLEGIAEEPLPPGVTNLLFHVGIDHEGKALWYNNAHLLNGPYYYRLSGVDLEVLPNGQVFSSMYMTEVNNLLIGSATLPASNYTYSSLLVELKPDIELGGTVSDETGNPVFPGMVMAVKSSAWGSYPMVDSAVIQDDGSYLFTELYPGEYVIQARTYMQDYPEGIPTYYGNQERWSSALPIEVTPDIKANILNITLSEVPKLSSMDGSGELNGTLSTEEGTYLKGTMAQPKKRTGVILLGKSKKSTHSGEVVAYVESDDQGHYVFDNVPDGEYLLVVDVAGLDMMDTHDVTIAGSQIISGLNYTVSNEGIYAGWPTAVNPSEPKVFKIWPNPGDGRILMDLPEAGDYTVKIYSTDGRLIRSEYVAASGGHSTVDIREENKGLYILQIEGPGTSTTRKYIKR